MNRRALVIGSFLATVVQTLAVVVALIEHDSFYLLVAIYVELVDQGLRRRR